MICPVCGNQHGKTLDELWERERERDSLAEENKDIDADYEKVTVQRDMLLDALRSLYSHTKNNMSICGLNEQAKAALAKVGAGQCAEEEW